MKLHYYHDPEGNFGDDLNPWLWPKLIPSCFDDSDDEWFVGIGTLLNHRLPPEKKKHVFGAGVGYGDPPVVDNGNMVVHAVRGPLSAARLGVSGKLAITDAAILVRVVDVPVASSKAYKLGLIPTGHSISNFDWAELCREIGVNYISCHWEVERVMEEMSRCEAVICEAMHGAIVADSLRIPWYPVSLYGALFDFKWKDWLSTLDIPYEPIRVTPLYSEKAVARAGGMMKRGAKRLLTSMKMGRAEWDDIPLAASAQRDREAAMRQLLAIGRASPRLSADSVVERHTARFMDLVSRFNSSVCGP